MKTGERIPLHDHVDNNSGGRLPSQAVPACEGGGSATTGFDGIAEHLVTGEGDTTLVLAPDGSGGVDWVSGAGASSPDWFNVRDYGAVADGTTDSTLAIQAAISACATAGGGIVYFPASASTYRISSQVSGQRYGITVPSNVNLMGDGMYASMIEYDPTQTLPAGSIFIPIELSTASASASLIHISDLGLISNMSILGTSSGPFIEGICARQDGDVTKHVDDVVIERVYVLDANGAIYACKDGSVSGAGNIANQHKRWAVRDCVIDSSANKAIEMQQIDTFEVTGNVCVNCVDGLQAINYSQHGIFSGNNVEYMAAGQSLTEGVADIVVDGNVYNCIGGAGTFVGGLILRREPFTGSITAANRIVVSNNVFRDWTSSQKVGLLFATFTGNTGVGTFQDVQIVDNIFDAETNYLYDPYFPAKSAATRLRIEGNYFANTTNSSGSWSSDRTFFAHNYIGANFTMNSLNWDLRENRFAGTFTLVGTGCTFNDGYVRNVNVSSSSPSSGDILRASSSTAAAWASLATAGIAATTDVILKSFLDAKGDLISATADNTPALLPVGTDGYKLTARSTASTGLAWEADTTSGAVDHAHVADERHLSDGSTTTYTLDEAFLDGSVTAMNITTLAWLGVTEVAPDQATVSAAGSSGDTIQFTYAAVAV